MPIFIPKAAEFLKLPARPHATVDEMVGHKSG